MKNIPVKRILAALLAVACMMALLAGCGKKDGDDGQGGAGGSNGGTSSDFVYVASYQNLSGDFNSIGSADVHDGKIYFQSYIASSVDEEGNVYTEEDEEYWQYYKDYPTLFCVDMATGASEELSNYKIAELPEGYEGYTNVQSLAVDNEGNIWVAERTSTYYYDAPEGVTPEDEEYYNYYVEGEEEYVIRKLDSTGAELDRIDISAVSEAAQSSVGNDEEMMYFYFYIENFVIDDAGNLFLCTGDNGVYVLDPTGEILFNVAFESWIRSIVKLSDGTIAAMGYDGEGQTLKKIDVDAKDWGEKLAVPSNCDQLYAGGGDYLYYCSSGTNFYGYNTKTGENEKLLNWLSSNVDGENLSAVVPLEDGRILAMESSWDYSDNVGKYSCNLVTLTKTPASEAPQKTTITYACIYLDYMMRSQILNFNRNNDKYSIEVLDYSEYNTEDDYEAGLTKLTTEIISGNAPDLMSTDNLPFSKYAAKGLFEDLYPYLDSDSEISRSDIIPAVLTALETEGKLYQVSDSFGVYTIMGDADKIGSEPGWTIDEMMEVINQMPDGMDVFDSTTTRDEILRMMCMFSLEDFVNWQTGECSFDSGEFAKILEFANSFPSEFDWDNYEYDDDDQPPTRIMSGKQLLMSQSFSDFEDYQFYTGIFNNNAVCKGFPCADRNGNALSFNNGIAMSSSCKDKEGAWEFIKSFLSHEGQSSNMWRWRFPTSQKAYDEMLEEAMTPTYYTDPETGEEVEQPKTSWGWGSFNMEIHAISQEQADAIMDVINSATKSYTYDEDIMNIITEEAAAYFNGDKSAQQVADLIQSRTKIYVNEQR